MSNFRSQYTQKKNPSDQSFYCTRLFRPHILAKHTGDSMSSIKPVIIEATLALRTFDLGHFSKGSGRPENITFLQTKILYKVILRKIGWMEYLCGITYKYIQVPEKVSNYYNVTCHDNQIQAFVRSKTNLPKLGRLRTCYPMQWSFIPQKQVFWVLRNECLVQQFTTKLAQKNIIKSLIFLLSSINIHFSGCILLLPLLVLTSYAWVFTHCVQTSCTFPLVLE